MRYSHVRSVFSGGSCAIVAVGIGITILVDGQ